MLYRRGYADRYDCSGFYGFMHVARLACTHWPCTH